MTLFLRVFKELEIFVNIFNYYFTRVNKLFTYYKSPN